MKVKNLNAKKLNKNVKKLQEKLKKTSINSSFENNDDSLDDIQSTQIKQKHIDHKSTQEINEEDMKQLRTCISNQFKKTNFINFSAIKSQNFPVSEPLVLLADLRKSEQKLQSINKSIKISGSHQNKGKMFSSHNRSQSCPFIQPLSIYDTIRMKGRKNYDFNIVQPTTKLEKQYRKKISIQHLGKNRNKFNIGGSAQKKNINHNYSNSLTQSSNTVIVHNIPYQNHTIAPNQNLSSILYKKAEQDEQVQTIKQKSRQDNTYSQFLKQKKNKQLQETYRTEQKKPQLKIKIQQNLLLKTKIQQKIHQYNLQQELHKIKVDSKRTVIKQDVLQNVLHRYKVLKTQQNQNRKETATNYENKKDKNNSFNQKNSSSRNKTNLNRIYQDLLKNEISQDEQQLY